MSFVVATRKITAEHLKETMLRRLKEDPKFEQSTLRRLRDQAIVEMTWFNPQHRTAVVKFSQNYAEKVEQIFPIPMMVTPSVENIVMSTKDWVNAWPYECEVLVDNYDDEDKVLKIYVIKIV